MLDSKIDFLQSEYEKYSDFGTGFIQKFLLECVLPLALSELNLEIDIQESDLTCSTKFLKNISDLGFSINLSDSKDIPSYFICTFFINLELLLVVEFMTSQNQITDCELVEMDSDVILKLSKIFFEGDISNQREQNRESADSYEYKRLWY